jgi:putative ABC transport system permease protein
VVTSRPWGRKRRISDSLVFGEGFLLIACGILIGVATAVLLSGALRTFLYGVEPTDPLTMLVVGLLFAAVAMLAFWVPTRRATRGVPLEALKYELRF